MAITYTYTVDGLDAPDDIVSCVRCRLTGTDGTASESVAFSVDIPQKKPFKPLADLAEADVIKWIEPALGNNLGPIKAEIEQRLARIAPPSPRLPWAPAEAASEESASIDDIV